MNKKDLKKKLELNRETVKTLGDKDLDDVNGGSALSISVKVLSRWVGSAIGWILC